ncbi:hypothetical protein ACFOE1_06385 [Agromyces mediolanus]|uniref:Uncharacterized protein n=1 Tax=Agromyces mediolanus TaxID=41986 RepID=A0A918CJ61_AGRME|nr:hypothetical protein [Agromyces mediolanus]GGR27320.1 hypothetical protein GCM10010196_21120 [Agromyces mediolanus]GLJ71908.1 hypothetical protein GCM10017583_11640 [Agromyces mediolanus]
MLTEYAEVGVAAAAIAAVWLVAIVIGLTATSLRKLEPVAPATDEETAVIASA